MAEQKGEKQENRKFQFPLLKFDNYLSLLWEIITGIVWFQNLQLQELFLVFKVMCDH